MAKADTSYIEAQLIKAGVQNLKEYGYPGCTKDNILTDAIYKAFFLSMLEDNKGKAGVLVDKAIDNLIGKIGK